MTNTTYAFPIPALDWLETNIKPILASRSVKRLAFRVLVDDNDMILTADMTGKSQPVYGLIEDEGQDPVEVNGKPTAIIAPPDNLDAFESLMAGGDVPFSAEESDETDEDLADEISGALSLSSEDEGFTPQARTMDLNVGNEAPAPIPMPAPVKKSKKKADAKSIRTKLLEKFCNELGVQIPDPEDMFRKFKNNPAVRFVSFKELAACNHPGKLMTAPKGDFAKGLAEIMDYHRDNNIRNVLNLSAEIDPNRVMALVTTLLRYGRLIHCLEAASLTDAPPHSALLSPDGSTTEPYDEKAFQVWTGRHRAWALAFIYGIEVELPVMVSDMDFRTAAEECVESNKCRPMGKQEQIHYEAVQRSLTLGDSPASQFVSLKGDKKKVANFVVYHTIVQPDSDVFVHPKVLQVGAKRTPKNITLPFYRSAIEFALTGAGLNHSVKLDGKTVKGINLIVSALDTLFARIEQEFTLDAERKLVWTYYSAGAFGMLLGEKLHPFIHEKKDGDAAAEAAEAVVKMVLGMFEATDTETAKNKLAKEPPASLTAYLSLYGDSAEEKEEEDADESDGILS